MECYFTARELVITSSRVEWNAALVTVIKSCESEKLLKLLHLFQPTYEATFMMLLQ